MEFLLSSSWPFSVSDVVQPVALQVLRPLVTVVSGGTGQGGCASLGFVMVLLILL